LYPKIWFFKHLIADIGLVVLTFLPDLMISLIIAGVIVAAVLILDLYTHYKEFTFGHRNKKL
jgi:hypothetical protein